MESWERGVFKYWGVSRASGVPRMARQLDSKFLPLDGGAR